MTLLKIKALIYDWTGIYLAHREENDYCDSEAYWKQYNETMSAYSDDPISPRALHGLLVGSWQAKHRFVRKSNKRLFEFVRNRKRK